jgi:hypothetical protein
MERSELLVRDFMSELDEAQRLQVVEASCIYRNTSTMKEASQPAVVEASYSSAGTFKAATRYASRDPHVVKRLGRSLSIPLVLDSLATLFDTCLLDRVDSVIIHYGGTTVIRFTNTAQEPSEYSSSVCLPIPDICACAADAIQSTMHVKAAQPSTSSCQLSLPACLPSRVSLSPASLNE